MVILKYEILRRCRLVAPSWLVVDRLEEARDQEREEALFTELPAPHMFVVANLLLDVATQVVFDDTILACEDGVC